MSDKPTLEELLEVQEHFGLPGPALVEKDWHVVKASAAIAAAAGFEFDPENEKHRVSMWKGHYTKYQLPYKPLAQGKGLRPDVQIETSVWPLRREAVDKPVISFIAEAYGRDPELPRIACSSVLETAAEKVIDRFANIVELGDEDCVGWNYVDVLVGERCACSPRSEFIS